MVVAAIALGSNLGDRRAHLDYAASRLSSLLRDIRVSRYIETAPVDVPDEQPPFLNAADLFITIYSVFLPKCHNAELPTLA